MGSHTSKDKACPYVFVMVFFVVVVVFFVMVFKASSYEVVKTSHYCGGEILVIPLTQWLLLVMQMKKGKGS